MADENEINKEESANSLTRDSSSQVRGNKYSLRNRRSQINAVNVPDPDEARNTKTRNAGIAKTKSAKAGMKKSVGKGSEYSCL